MGKRWSLLLAFISFIAVSTTGVVTSVSQSNSQFSPLNSAKAQEINPEVTLTLINKGSIINDSVAEKSIVSDPVTASSDTVEIKTWATAYTSDPSETKDYDIGITALGTKTREGVVAANFLPFGTKFKIPSVYGDRIFTVEDRMNSRYNNQRIVDIWMPKKADALNFGKKVLTLELL